MWSGEPGFGIRDDGRLWAEFIQHLQPWRQVPGNCFRQHGDSPASQIRKGIFSLPKQASVLEKESGAVVDLPTRISCITSPAPGSAYRMLYARPRAGKGTQRDRPVRWRQAKHQAVNFTSGASAVSKIFSSSEDLLTPGIGLNNHLRATKYLVATALNSRKSRLMLPEPRFG